MKKIYSSIVLLFAIFSNAQLLNENFEGNVFPPTGWTYFETGSGVTVNWAQTINPLLVCGGSGSAYLNRENVSNNTLAIDWLVTPLLSVASNGKLYFTTKTIQAGFQGNIFSVKVSTTSQTDPNSFITVASWDENTLTTTANNCQEKMVDLSSYDGQNVYIAFVMENDNGDRWILDNIRMYENSIQSIAFIDLNNNGVKDTNETYFNNGDFQVSVNNGSTINYAGTNGILNLFPQNSTDAHNISYIIHPEYSGYFSSNTTYTNLSSAQLGNGAILNFPITVTNPFSDVGINLYTSRSPRAGLNYYNGFSYRNNGTVVENGVIQYTKPTNVSIIDISDINAVQNATGFTLNYSNLQPQETRYFGVNMLVPTIPTVQIGEAVNSSVTINTTNTDIFPNNNNSILNKTIVAAYDPNDKSENQGPTIVKDNFTNEDYLIYTIHFQNEGNANTSVVRVEDFLDVKLNPATVRMIGASHDYVMSMQNNHLVWKFDPIYLTPQSVDEANSQGYITFKVKPFPGYQIGDIIPNTASIYFDTNPAIVTNTFQTEFIAALSNESFGLDAFTIFPNPSNEFINISVGQNENQMQSFEITDVLGKKVLQSKFENRINISNLNQGVYFITLITKENIKITKKIIKE